MTKVMLVEDDNNLREIYEARLQAEGYDIVAAKDGEEALVMAKEHKPELVISDVMMPKISGFEMLDILRNTDGLKDVKVIMLTALGQSDDQARADKLGADRYLVKSQVTLEDIVTVARELIDGDAPVAPTATPATPAPDPAPVAAPEPAVEPAEPIAVAVEPPAAPVSEPVATTPAPVATPDPAPVAEPAATDTDTQSTAQEEASVEAKIEDFVAGATSDPGGPEAATTPATPAPDPAPVAAPEPAVEPAEPIVAPEAPTATEKATATDDKLMADAVDTLMANTEANVKPSATVVTSEPAATSETPVIVPDKTPEVVAEKTAAELGSVPINGKKVISPVDSGEAKPSIEALLAKEEAKNIQAGDVVPPAAPATPSTVVSPGGVDPNSIAL